MKIKLEIEYTTQRVGDYLKLAIFLKFFFKFIYFDVFIL
jgi:hypothetical protein